MGRIEDTTAAALIASGFTKLVDYGRLELYTNGDVFKLFDSQLGKSIVETHADPARAARIHGLAIILITLIQRPELGLPAGARTGFINAILALIEI